jgi:hypothetical protein
MKPQYWIGILAIAGSLTGTIDVLETAKIKPMQIKMNQKYFTGLNLFLNIIKKSFPDGHVLKNQINMNILKILK